ncbi:MAG: hypothetical protein KatS3mg019_0489 [Fimbriimonadales bacterium]|nr:MAG: hypothetical protein KatS3mg019_0489 [Fimbriimonadales bacterium]
MALNYEDYIETRTGVCGGQPVIKGTRLPLRVVLACLAAGDTPEQILEEFPVLTPNALRAVIAFAAQSALEDIPLPPVPAVKR